MTPSEEHLSFYYETGLAFTQWAHLEWSILQVVLALTPKPERRAITSGYYAIENFRSKLAYADNVLGEKLAGVKGHVDRWAVLVERIKAASKARNKIAHYTPMSFAHEKNRIGRRIGLVQWLDHEKTNWAGKSLGGKTPDGALCVRDIVAIRLVFTALMIELMNFSYLLSDGVEPLAKYCGQTVNPPTTRVLKNQIRELLGLPLQPSRK